MDKYSKALEPGYHILDLDIKNLDSSIKVNVEGKEFFMTLFLFQNDRQICQIICNRTASRIISHDVLSTSPACEPLDPEASLSLEYALFNFGGNNSVELIIEATKEDEIRRYSNEIDIYEEKTICEDRKWYAGDFHTHTYYSDGKLSREENLILANMRDLDFFTPTEHNVFHKTWPDSNILINPGMEFTSNLGHFNILFSKISSLEKGELGMFETEEEFTKLLEKYSNYGIVSLNHPFLAPWELKMGDFDLKKIITMEIINDPTFEDNYEANEKTLKAWSILLNDGYKVVGIGGSDSHNIPQEVYKNSLFPSLIGDPKTWIYANSLSKKELKQALIDGKVAVSREDLIDLNNDGNKFYAEVYRKTYHKSDLKIQRIVNGEIVKETLSNTDDFEFDPGDKYSWIRVDVRTSEDLLFGFTNPIFFNKDKKLDHQLFTWNDLLDKMND